MEVHDEDGIRKMRASCRLAAEVLRKAGEMVRPGVSTDEIDAAVHKWIIEAGAYPSPLNYGRFPKVTAMAPPEKLPVEGRAGLPGEHFHAVLKAPLSEDRMARGHSMSSTIVISRHACPRDEAV